MESERRKVEEKVYKCYIIQQLIAAQICCLAKLSCILRASRANNTSTKVSDSRLLNLPLATQKTLSLFEPSVAMAFFSVASRDRCPYSLHQQL